MADESKSGKDLDSAVKELGKVAPLQEIPAELQVDYAEREPDRVIPKKGSDGYETPSGRALSEVGEFKGNPVEDQEAAKAHGLRYLAAKLRMRWGYGA